MLTHAAPGPGKLLGFVLPPVCGFESPNSKTKIAGFGELSSNLDSRKNSGSKPCGFEGKNQVFSRTTNTGSFPGPVPLILSPLHLALDRRTYNMRSTCAQRLRLHDLAARAGEFGAFSYILL